jgi:adenosylcobinamide kinase/adenosylcobinamide-phosphate guanylyltransferase
MPATLVLGGARSGKTAYAQSAALDAAAGVRPIMIATAEALDDEMRARIDRHVADRGDAWTTVEAPLHLAEALSLLQASDVVVVDCLTLWLTNLMMAERDLGVAFADLEAAIVACPARLWLVSNEVGGGIAPDNALARRFRDEAGFLHQRLARVAASVVLVVAGLPLSLKSTS